MRVIAINTAGTIALASFIAQNQTFGEYIFEESDCKVRA
jgi:hypothetical protein